VVYPLYLSVKSAYDNLQKEKEKELEKQMPLQQSWELASHFEKIKSQARQRRQHQQEQLQLQLQDQMELGDEQQPAHTPPARRSFERAAAATQNQFKWIDDV
jgi:hypothetical protein